jgi:hypothetical protein
MLTQVHKHTILREQPIEEAPILDKRRIPALPAPPEAQPDERAARRSLRRQIARLEEELAGLVTSAWPAREAVAGTEAPAGSTAGAAGSAGARALPLGELEACRDDLSERVRAAKAHLALGAEEQERSRRAIEEMQLDPAGHRWMRVTNEDIGEPGCKNWHVRPRAGLLGMLMGWWRVIVSSGCP